MANKKIPRKKVTPKEEFDKNVIEKIQDALETFRIVIVTIAANGAENYNTVLGLLGNKAMVNAQLEDLHNRVQELEKGFKILISQQSFQKVPDLVDKLTATSEEIKNALIDVQRCTYPGDNPEK